MQLFIEKCQFFNQNNQWLKNVIYPLNSQFTIVLNSTFILSVRFCNNSLLVLKIVFQVFSFASKKVQGFSSDRKISMLLYSLPFHLKNCVSVFWNFNFQARYLGECSWNQPHFLRNSDKSLLSPAQKKLKGLWDTDL